MVHDADPPILLRDVYGDLDEVVRLVERSAPYSPLGGWMRPGLDPDIENSPMWFQNDWVHADFKLEGSDLFFQNQKYIETAREFWGAEEIVPQSIYTNVMVGLCECGPVHTDNPKFRGRERKNTPMLLLRTMLWSELFTRWEIRQVTAIWWLNDVAEGGGLAYWADGPLKPPRRHVGDMANTAIIGDNHHMFHQVEPVGPLAGGTRLVTASAKLGPADDGSGDWVVLDKGQEALRGPLSDYRVSVLWKADVYQNEAERRELARDTLSIEDVASIFNRDLEQRGEALRLDLERLDDLEHLRALGAVYPEPIPVGTGPSIYDTPGA